MVCDGSEHIQDSKAHKILVEEETPTEEESPGKRRTENSECDRGISVEHDKNKQKGGS